MKAAMNLASLKSQEEQHIFLDSTPIKPLPLTSECLGAVPLSVKDEKRPDSVHEVRKKCL